MKTFLNLRLSARLGAAFGFLVLALVISAAVALSGLGKVEDSAKRLSDHDVAALGHLVTVSEDFLASGYRVVRHLYVEDGDLRAQDKTAKEIAEFEKEARTALDGLRPQIQGREAEATFAKFEQGLERFQAAADNTIRLSRQETVDGVEERDGSRTAYVEKVSPVLENLDVVHDELEGFVSEQAAANVQGAQPHGMGGRGSYTRSPAGCAASSPCP